MSSTIRPIFGSAKVVVEGGGGDDGPAEGVAAAGVANERLLDAYLHITRGVPSR